jgi:hypothetical protein
MRTDDDYCATLRKRWASPSVTTDTDYTLLEKVGTAYAARSRTGLPALVVPISPTAGLLVGRRASGFELIAHHTLRYRFAGEEWDGPAAALVGAEADVADSFAVLAADVARRAERDSTWKTQLAAVEEWQALLAPRGRPTTETEVGLWGELWFLSQSRDVDRALAGWRGPDRDTSDFYVDGIAAEVKTSRVRRQHHVSLAQVAPGDVAFESWLVSLWVKIDPASALTVPVLVASVIERAADRGEAMRRIARAGFNMNDRREFISGYVLASDPEWYPVDRVPRVRAADPGVSQLRYRVTLDDSRRADSAAVERLVRHFHGKTTGVF